MGGRLAAAMAVAAFVAAGCSSGTPVADEYRVGDIDTIDTERHRSGGDCSFDYRSELYSLDPQTGRMAWAIEFPYTASPLYLHDGGVLAAVNESVSLPAGLLSIDGEGDPRWRAEVPNGGGRVFDATDDLLLVASVEENTKLFRVGRDGTLRWETDFEAFVFSGPYLVGSSVILTTASNTLMVIDADTGSTINERNIGYEVSGVGLVVDDLVYTAAYDGFIVAINDAGRMIEYPADDHPHQVVGVIDGLVVYTNDIGISALDLGSREIVWHQESVGSTAAQAGDSLLLTVSPQGFRSIDPLTAELEWQFFGRSGSVMHMVWADPIALATIRLGDAERVATSFLVAAVDPADTEMLAWDQPLPGRPSLLEMADDVLLVGGGLIGGGVGVETEDTGWLIAMDPATGEQLWELVMREPPASLAYERPTAFVLTADELVFCD